jgi:hypothetical protein
MLIRQELLEAFDAEAQARFETEVLEHLRKVMPREAAALEPAVLRKFVATGAKWAEVYGFKARGPVRTYVLLMALLGHRFDADPLYFWIGDILRDNANLDEMTQAVRLHMHVSGYRELVDGETRENSAEAQARLSQVTTQQLATVGQNLDSSGIPWLQTLHLRRCAFAGEPALRNLIQAAREAAAHFQLPPPEGPALILGLMFVFGAGVLTDPLRGWLASAVKAEAEGDAATRVDRILSRIRPQLSPAAVPAATGAK